MSTSFARAVKIGLRGNYIVPVREGISGLYAKVLNEPKIQLYLNDIVAEVVNWKLSSMFDYGPQ